MSPEEWEASQTKSKVSVSPEEWDSQQASSDKSGETKGIKEAVAKGQVYVKPLPGLSAKTTAGIYSAAEAMSNTVRGVGQLLGIGNDSTKEEVQKAESLTKNPEYKVSAYTGKVLGTIADPTNFVPLGAAATLPKFIKQSATVGGIGGFLGATAEDGMQGRGEHAVEGAVGGAAGGLVLGSVLRAGGKMFGKDWLPWKASEVEKQQVFDKVVEENPTITKEELNHFIDAPEDKHINAKAKAEKLLSENSPKRKVDAAVEKDPLVGHYIDEYQARYNNLKESKVGEVSQGEVLPIEKTTTTSTPELPSGSIPTETPLPSIQNKEAGVGNTQLLADVAGAGTGAALDPSDPLTGAAIGLGVAHGGGMLAAKVADKLISKTPIKDSPVGEFISSIGEGVDKAFGLLGTRISNESPEVGRHALDLERNIKKETFDAITPADSFFSHVQKNMKPQAEEIKNAWMNGDRNTITNTLKASGNKEALKSFESMTTKLDSLGKELKDRGLVSGLVEGYLPRIVKDRKGLLNSLGFELKTDITKALDEAARKKGLSLDDVETSNIINKFMRGSAPSGVGKPGFTKNRAFTDVSKDMQQYYYDPVETYHTYMNRAISEKNTADFFGKSTLTKDGQLDVDGSIGNYLADLQSKGKIQPEQFDTLKSLLETRYKFGNQISNKYIQEYKNWTTGILLSDIGSSIQNLGDLTMSNFIYGMKPAMSSIVQTLTGKNKLTVKDFGLMDHIAEEFVSTSRSKKYVDRAMKLSGWGILDPLGKEVALNASLNRAQNWSKSDRGIQSLQQRYADAYGADFTQLVKDLQSGTISDLVKSMAFFDVVKHQPLTKLQKTELATKYPNAGGVVYMLKSFMLNQANLVREEAYNRAIKKGDVAGGIAKLAILGTGFAAVGASNKQIQNFLLGKDEEFKGSDLFWNAIKEFGASKKLVTDIGNGKWWDAAGDVAAPPNALVKGWIKEDPSTGDTVIDNAGVAKKLPVIGRELSARFYAPTPEQAKADKRKLMIRHRAENLRKKMEDF